MAGNLHTFIQQMRFWANIENPGVGYWDTRPVVDATSGLATCRSI